MTTLRQSFLNDVLFKMVSATDETPLLGIADDITINIFTGSNIIDISISSNVQEVGLGWYTATIDTQSNTVASGDLAFEASAPGAETWSFLYTVVQQTLLPSDLDAMFRYLLLTSINLAGVTNAQQIDRNLLNFIRSGLGQNRLTIPSMSGPAVGYREDDVTPARTYTITTDANGAPISQIDPV